MAKVFQILVPDGKLVSRIISCETQVTELFVIDRSDKDFVSASAEDLMKPALYILVNRDSKQLYVGETDDSYKRLKNHEAKDFWTEAIVFHSTGETLTTTEVKWLEAETYCVLSKLGYYDLSQNKQTPQHPTLKKNQKYNLNSIFEEAKAYICAAGFDIFLRSKDEQQEQEEIPEEHDSEQFYLSSKRCLPSYFSSVKSPFIRNILKELNMPENIFDITNLDDLEMVRREVAKAEKTRGFHNQYSCSISQLKHYISNGLTYKEFEHDAMFVKREKSKKK